MRSVFDYLLSIKIIETIFTGQLLVKKKLIFFRVRNGNLGVKKNSVHLSYSEQLLKMLIFSPCSWFRRSWINKMIDIIHCSIFSLIERLLNLVVNKVKSAESFDFAIWQTMLLMQFSLISLMLLSFIFRLIQLVKKGIH